jgi:hypothetical protein
MRRTYELLDYELYSERFRLPRHVVCFLSLWHAFFFPSKFAMSCFKKMLFELC